MYPRSSHFCQNQSRKCAGYTTHTGPAKNASVWRFSRQMCKISRTIQPQGSCFLCVCVPLYWAKLWWLFFWTLLSQITLYLFAFKSIDVFKQFKRLRLTHQAFQKRCFGEDLNKVIIFFLFFCIALLLHYWDHWYCNDCSSRWSCNNWRRFFFVTTPLSHRHLISIPIRKKERITRRLLEDKNPSHSSYINHMGPSVGHLQEELREGLLQESEARH